ncbi:hypothetical protein SARC_10863, partial [Sphaeroforma arctica JP610]
FTMSFMLNAWRTQPVIFMSFVFTGFGLLSFYAGPIRYKKGYDYTPPLSYPGEYYVFCSIDFDMFQTSFFNLSDRYQSPLKCMRYWDDRLGVPVQIEMLMVYGKCIQESSNVRFA